MTQAELALKSGVSRPNLSAIEQGARDMTVGTLRMIAFALDTTAGALVDGAHPGAIHLELDRSAMDRVARLAAGQRLKASASEKQLARELAAVLRSKVDLGGRHAGAGHIRSTDHRLLMLKAELGPGIFQNLIKRVEKNLMSAKPNHE